MSRQYTSASSIVNAVLIQGKSLKGFCANTSRNNSKIGKVDYAIACETIKYSHIIKALLTECSLTKELLEINNEGILFVMLYELLFGAGKISGGGAVKRKLMLHLDKLKEQLDIMMQSKGIAHVKDLLSTEVQQHSSIPIYVRVNQLKVNLEEAMVEIQKLVPTKHIYYDRHIPSVVALPPNHKGLGEHPWVRSGFLIIQDKASCFPSQVLVDHFLALGLKGNLDIVDACAAPGNKTSHMASLISQKVSLSNSKVKIIAFDKNQRRADLLKSRMIQAGSQNYVTVRNEDFLSIDTENESYKNVTACLCDPSCSGSGVIRSLDRIVQDEHNSGKSTEFPEERLKQLHDFQVSIVRKAMSFPNAKIVVYSTCSIHIQENEDVVSDILEGDVSKKWQLLEPLTMSEWSRRGINNNRLSKEQLHCLLRCFPEDGMNGFFVALFIKQDDEDIPKLVPYSDDEECDLDFNLSSNKRKLDSVWWHPFHKIRFY